jgi:hypothetical protein
MTKWMNPGPAGEADMGDFRHSSDTDKTRNVEVHDANEATVRSERTADRGVEVYDRPERGTGTRLLPTLVTLILIVVIGVILYQVLF